MSLQEALLRAWLRDASTPLPGDLVQLGGEELGIALQRAEVWGGCSSHDLDGFLWCFFFVF